MQKRALGAGSASLQLPGGRRGVDSKVSWTQTQTYSRLVMSEPSDC